MSSRQDLVYRTNSGSKFHRDGCEWLKSRIPIKRDEARLYGLTPCSVCSP